MRFTVLVGASAVVLSLAACGSSTPSSTTAPPAAAQATSEAPAPVPEEPTAEPTTEPAETVISVKMPDATGMVLQDAQDLMQKVTGNPVFVTKSHDLRFTRMQVLDSGWKVCSQSVKKGKKFDPATTKIDFGVVKVDESCP